MGDLMACPACGAPLVDVQDLAGLTVCRACLRTLVLGDPVRLATGADTVPLDARTLGALRDLRKAARKARV